MFDYYFENLENSPDAIILGCTHFPLIADSIPNYLNNKPLIVHSWEKAIVEYLDTRKAIADYHT